MTLKEKTALRRAFFKKLGHNAETFKLAFDAVASYCLCIKDLQGRIMALNRRNCEVCNIRDEWDAIGLTSDSIFPSSYAKAYMTLDQEVMRTGKPIIGRITEYPTDLSTSFMVSDIYPLKDRVGRLVGIMRVYRLTEASEENAFDRYGQMRRVADHIAAHYAENIRLEQLVALTGMSTSRFERIFTATFGMPPARYVNLTRVNAARALLENTDKLLSEIAAETGFFDQSHLTRIFKKERGVTPGQYRRRHNNLHDE